MKEHRKSERVIPAQQPKGRLSLYVDDRCYEVKEVRDVSPFGIGVRVEANLGKDAEVRLSYQSGDETLQVFGVIAWGSQVEEKVSGKYVEGLYRTGICLRPEDVEANLSFYKLITSRS